MIEILTLTFMSSNFFCYFTVNSMPAMYRNSGLTVIITEGILLTPKLLLLLLHVLIVEANYASQN